MASLTFAAKANAAFLLPTLLAAAYIQKTSPDTNMTTVFEDVESLGAHDGMVELKSSDGSLIYDDAVLSHLQENFAALQAGNKDQARLAHPATSFLSHQFR
jgi:glutamyl-tRNA synthetase